MLSSPIVRVELLTVGRRRRYFALRVLYGMVMLVAMWLSYNAAVSWGTPSLQQEAAFASRFFAAFSFIQLFAVMFLAPPMIAGTIASEHERRTIDYLLTTQLGDSEIALGKFGARMWAVVTQVLVGLPILAIAMSMGGISPRQLVESFGVTLLALFSTGSLAIAISSRTRKSRDAVTRTYVVVIGAMLAPVLLLSISTYLRYEFDGSWVGDAAETVAEWAVWGMLLNPAVFLVRAILDVAPVLPFGMSTFAAVHGGIGVGCCLPAVRSVRRYYLQLQGTSTRGVETPRIAAAPALGTVPQASAAATADEALEATSAMFVEASDERQADLSDDSAGDVPTSFAAEAEERVAAAVTPHAPAGMVGVRFRHLLDADQPMWWKERVAQKTLGRLGWPARIATVLLYGGAWFWLLTAVMYSLDWTSTRGFGSMSSPIMIYTAAGAPTFACFGMLLTAVRAAGSITAEREQDTWISLIATPLEAGEIVRAKMAGAAFSVRYWYLLIVVAWGFCILVHPNFLVVAPILAVVYALGLWFAATVGIFFSLRQGTSVKAMGSTLALLVLGTGIGPVVLAAIVDSEKLIAFSLPVVIGAPHVIAMEAMDWNGALSTHTKDFIWFLALATAGYLAAAIALFIGCVRQFDAFIGRIVARADWPWAEAWRGATGGAGGRAAGKPEGRPPGELPEGSTGGLPDALPSELPDDLSAGASGELPGPMAGESPVPER